MDKLRGTAEMTAAMIISGTIGWFVILSGQPVIDVVFWRCLFGAGTLALICLGLGLYRGDVITVRQIGLAVIGGVAIVANWLMLFAAYPRASISIATAVYNTQPFMLVGFGVLFFSEKLTASKLFWLGLAFAGMLGIVQAKSGAAGTGYLVGIGLALGAAFFYAIAALVAKKLKGVPPHLIALIQVIVGTLMLAPLASLAHPPTGEQTWAILGTLGVVHTGLMYILLYGAIQKLPTSLTGALSFIYPVVAILVDFVAFGHRLDWLQMVGAGAILVAAAGMTLGWSPLRRNETAVPGTPASPRS
ncbi:DMT family transporter [Labrys sp. KB_33_2]|uniref:DMT family transporter n=1 Tax=Labrys sp. KB_33_2 TaxID=3237479 RepID=UPI003F91DA6A